MKSKRQTESRQRAAAQQATADSAIDSAIAQSAAAADALAKQGSTQQLNKGANQSANQSGGKALTQVGGLAHNYKQLNPTRARAYGSGKNAGGKNAGPQARRPWTRLFLATLARCANVTVSCRTVDITVKAAYDRRKRYPKFAEQWDAAITEAIDLLEASAWARATQGIERGVWSKDKEGNPVKVDTVREYSDRLHEVLLKAHRPEKYCPKIQQEISGPGGAPLAPVVAPTQVIITIPDNGRSAAQSVTDVPSKLISDKSE